MSYVDEASNFAQAEWSKAVPLVVPLAMDDEDPEYDEDWGRGYD